MSEPVSAFRCRYCRRGVMLVHRLTRQCAWCGSGHWVVATRLSWRERLTLWWTTGMVPWASLKDPS